MEDADPEDQNDPKERRSEVPLEESPYESGKVTPNTRIGADEQGLFLFEEEGSCFTRTGESPEKRQDPAQRPEGPISVDFEGPSDLKIYHEVPWCTRITVRKRTLEVVERHYPAINEHLPLRLLLQYLLFNRHVITLTSTLEGDGAPLPAEMLAWTAGRLEQYRSRNFPAKKMLWWADEALFDGEFEWTDWTWHPDSARRRHRRIEALSFPRAVNDALEWERKHPVAGVSNRLWFDTGTAYTSQSASDLRAGTQRLVQNHGADVFAEKGNPDVPRAIQTYLNDLPVDGFNQIVRDHIQEAYKVSQRLSDRSPEGDQDLGVRHARALLRAVEDCPKPFYEAKLNTPRLFAPESLQLLNREVRATLVQDWTLLDLKSAQLAVCAYQWDIAPLLEFLRAGGDIWDELTSFVTLPKPALKKALYAITFGARAHWFYSNPPSTLIGALSDEAGISPEEAEEARRDLMSHPLMRALHEAREQRISEIKSDGFIKDCFGTVMHLGSHGSKVDRLEAKTLTLLAAEAAAHEMRLLWPAFEEVIGQEKRCKIMLYAFDGFYIKVANPKRKDTWASKLQDAVDEQAERLGIPTRLEQET